MTVRGKMACQQVAAIAGRQGQTALLSGLVRRNAKACNERLAKSCRISKTEMRGGLAHRMPGMTRVDNAGIGRIKAFALDDVGDAAQLGEDAI